MIDTSKILTAVNSKLSELYPTYKIYGVETREGYTLPCFNTELIVNDCESKTSNIVCTSVEVLIDFIMLTPDTVLQMSVGDTLRKTFFKYIDVGDRVYHVASYNQGYTGDYGDIMTIVIKLNLYDNDHDKAVPDPIEGARINLKRK